MKGELSTLVLDPVLQQVQKQALPGKELMIAREAMTLSVLRSEGRSAFLPYLPEILSSTGDAVTLVYLDGFYNLEEVKARYPDGIDPRDMAWMFRRLLVALGHTVETGTVHGAVVPSHVMIQPEMHGMVLIDWCYSTPLDTVLLHQSDAYRDWYPSYARSGREVGMNLDVTMAAKCMIELIGGDGSNSILPDGLPREYGAFFRAATNPNMPVHPWDVKDSFDELLERLYGPRRFRPFSMA